MFTKLSRRGGALALLGIASLAVSGCMVSPGHGEYIGHYSTPIHAGGFTLTPHQLVWLEAWDPVNQYWVKISWDYTDNAPTPYHFDGYDWYHWQVSNLSIPKKYWSQGGWFRSCKLRATVNGHAIGTFTNWHGCYPDADSVSDLWNMCGAGDTVTIYGY